MALIKNSQIELIDLTDTRAAQLLLNTSLSNIQVKTDDGFRPNYESDSGNLPAYDTNGIPTGSDRAEVGLHIIPSLYFGQELISINNYKDKIFYEINGVSYSNNPDLGIETAEIFVNKYGELVHKKNLENNNLTITAEIDEYDNGIDYYEDITGYITLTSVSSYSNYLPLIHYDRNVFTSYDNDDIALTALLYKDGKEVDAISYSWSISPSVMVGETEVIIIGTNKELSLQRSYVANLATISCTMIASNGESYTAQVTITDKTDPLSSSIISSKGIAFTGSNEVTELTCDVYQGIELLNEGVVYNWSYLAEGNADFTDLSESKKTIEIVPQKYSSSAVTFRCIATYGNERTVAQTVILISPEFKTIINPSQIFVSALSTGELVGNDSSFTKTINFKLVDSSGNILTSEDLQTFEITPIVEEAGVNCFSFGGAPKDKPNTNENGEIVSYNWNYNITINFNEPEDGSFRFSQLDDSILFTIKYNYLGIQLSDEFYVVKNIRGVGIKQVEEWYLASSIKNSSELPPLGQPNWQKDKIPELTKENKYLWNCEVTSYLDGTSTDPTLPGIIGMFSEDGRSIEEVINYYLATNSTNREDLKPLEEWTTDVTHADALLSADKQYLWNYEKIIYNKLDNNNNISSETIPTIIGMYSRSIVATKEFYAVSSNSTEAPSMPEEDIDKWNPPENSDWTDKVNEIELNANQRYLWNYEVIKYGENDFTSTDPVIISIFSEDGAPGKGINEIINKYLATDDNTIAPEKNNPNWKTDPLETPISATTRYLWNYEIIKYTDGTIHETDPAMIGTYGRDSADSMVTSYSGSFIRMNDPDKRMIKRFVMYGKSTVVGSAEDYSLNIVHIGQNSDTNIYVTNGSTESTEMQVLLLQQYNQVLLLRGIPVEAGGNVMIDGQQYLSDTIEIHSDKTGKFIQRCAEIRGYDPSYPLPEGTPFLSMTGDLTAGALVVYALTEPIEMDYTPQRVEQILALNLYTPITEITNNEDAIMDIDCILTTVGEVQENVNNNQDQIQGVREEIENLGQEFRNLMRFDPNDGLHIGNNQDTTEVRIDSDSVDIRLGGETYTELGMNYVQFGNYQLRKSSDGGLVFKLKT